MKSGGRVREVIQAIEGGTMGNDVRSRLEAAEMARRYSARQVKLTTEQAQEQADAERTARLLKNAEKIRQEQISSMLLECSPDEREVVYRRIGRERPDLLGNGDVVE